MKIAGSTSNLFHDLVRNNTVNPNQTSFENILKNINSGKDSYTNTSSLKSDDLGLYTKSINKSIEFPLESGRYHIEFDRNYKGIEGNGIYTVQDKDTGIKIRISESELLIRKDAKSGMEFLLATDNTGKAILQQLFVTPELKSMLSEVTESIGKELKEAPLPDGSSVKRDSKTGLCCLLYTWSHPGQSEQMGAGIIFTSKEEQETFSKLADEWSLYPTINNNRTTAEWYATLELSGYIKRGNEGYLHISSDSISYNTYDKENHKKSWSILLADKYHEFVMENLFNMTDFTSANSWVQLLKESGIKNGFFEVWDKYDNGGNQVLGRRFP